MTRERRTVVITLGKHFCFGFRLFLRTIIFDVGEHHLLLLQVCGGGHTRVRLPLWRSRGRTRRFHNRLHLRCEWWTDGVSVQLCTLSLPVRKRLQPMRWVGIDAAVVGMLKGGEPVSTFVAPRVCCVALTILSALK